MIDPCPDWVSAEPFRNHVRDLICQTGLSWRMIAAHAGVAPRAIRSLLHGRRGGPLRHLHVSVARALTALSPEDIADADHEVVEIEPTRRLLHDLRMAGLDAHLDAYLPADDRRQLDDPGSWRCSRATAARMAACYDYLTQQPGPRRAASPDSKPATVEFAQHQLLDRKRANAWRNSGSTSHTTAETPRC